MISSVAAVALQVVVDATIPDGDPKLPDKLSTDLNTGISLAKGIALAAFMLGLILAAIKMTQAHRQHMGGAEAAAQVGWVVGAAWPEAVISTTPVATPSAWARKACRSATR